MLSRQEIIDKWNISYQVFSFLVIIQKLYNNLLAAQELTPSNMNVGEAK